MSCFQQLTVRSRGYRRQTNTHTYTHTFQRCVHSWPITRFKNMTRYFCQYICMDGNLRQLLQTLCRSYDKTTGLYKADHMTNKHSYPTQTIAKKKKNWIVLILVWWNGTHRTTWNFYV